VLKGAHHTCNYRTLGVLAVADLPVPRFDVALVGFLTGIPVDADDDLFLAIGRGNILNLSSRKLPKTGVTNLLNQN
jgi:hypothetical protein